MKVVLFLMLPVKSHYNISFGYADSLKKQGWDVIFTGTENLRNHVELEEFKFLNIKYIEEIEIKSAKSALGNLILSVVEKRTTINRFKLFINAMNSIEYVLKTYNPEIIYIDEHLNHYHPLLAKFCGKRILINTKLPTTFSLGVPPLTCSYVFKESFVFRIFSILLWISHILKRCFYTLLKKISFLGNDEDYFINKKIKRSGTVHNEVFTHFNSLHKSVKIAERINLVPYYMEYPWYNPKENERFFSIPYKSKIEKNFINFWQQISYVLEERKNKGKKIVLFTLGSINMSNTKKSVYIVNKILSAFSEKDNYTLIISCNEKLIDTKQLKESMLFFEWVPQSDLLNYCDLMITHGGTNSILECVRAKVKILSFPLNSESDHPANSARVVYNKWGIKGNIYYNSPVAIRKKILFLLENNS